MSRLQRAEVRYERASAALRAASDELRWAQIHYLEAAGWQRVRGSLGLGSIVWRLPSGGVLWTTYAAMREQRRREQRKAREKARRG